MAKIELPGKFGKVSKNHFHTEWDIHKRNINRAIALQKISSFYDPSLFGLGHQSQVKHFKGLSRAISTYLFANKIAYSPL